MPTALVQTPASWAAQRDSYAHRAREKFDRRESEFQAAMLRAIGAWLDEALPVALGSLTAASPQPGPRSARQSIAAVLNAFTLADADNIAARLLRTADRFVAFLDRDVVPIYNRMLDEVLGRATHDNRIGASLLDWRQQWLAERTQELVKVPDTITGIVRTALGALAQREGTSVDDAHDLVQTMLDRGYPQWTARARTIARTEVVGANNQGSLAAWSALADASGQTATKTWLATDDSRTRKHHRDMDGTTVPIGGSFTVGGRHEMNGPGDNHGPAGETINCRCTLTYAFPDEDHAPTLPDGLTAAMEDAVTEPSPATPAHVAAAINTGVAIMLTVAASDVARLAPDGDTSEWPGLHCTVGFHRDQADAIPEDAKSALLDALAPLADLLPLGAEAFATADFNPDSDERDPCAVLLVQSAELAEMHDAVTDALSGQQSTTFPIWIPHVALGYNVAVADVVPDGATGSEIVFDRLVVGWGPEQITITNPMPGIDNAEPPDGAVDTDAQTLTAAQEDAVTAPPAPLTDAAPAVTEPPQQNGQAEATGGDTGAVDLTPIGPTWRGPLAKLGVPSSDNRIIDPTGGVIRTLPLPLWYQRESSHGGQPAGTTVRVGRVLSCEVQGDVLYGTGDWDLDVPETYEARSHVDDGMGMVSVDLGVQAIGYADETGQPIDPALVDDGTNVCEVAIEWEFGGVTLVGFPAFDGVRITNDPVEEAEMTAETPLPYNPEPGAFAAASPEPPTVAEDGQSLTFTDGTVVAVGDQVAYSEAGTRKVGTLASIDAAASTASITPEPAADGTDAATDPLVVALADLLPMDPAATGDDTAQEGDGAMALLASSEVRPYTSAFFAKRDLAGPTPLTVNPETGEVYGHLATWNEPHQGKLMEGKIVHAPHSNRDYGDFHLSPVLMDDGSLLDVGRLTVGTGHAGPRGGHMAALAHYDNTGTQAAVVRAYEDDHGIQLTGQLIHDIEPAKVEELMRSPLSGDWRVRDGNMELCAALAVNAPGFPVRRLKPVIGQSSTGQQLSLVAACMVEQAPRKVGRSVQLPSGATIEASDFDALVAAAADALQRSNGPVRRGGGEGEALAMRRARARLALA